MKRHLCGAATLALSVVATWPAAAQDADAGWRVSVTPYLWVSAYDQDIVNNVTGEEIESSAEFGDLLDALDGLFIGKAEAQYGRAGAYADLLYLKLSADRTIERPILGSFDA